MSIFNKHNTAWERGDYPLFLGQAPALYDSVNVVHPELFELYKKQKATDWDEQEINLEQARLDMQSCPEEIKDVMLKNLALQWEFDSVASRAIAPLLAPFITNSEYWAAVLKVSEIEVLHALTYSEIVRQCVSNPNDIIQEVMKNENILGRMEPVIQAFDKLRIAGAQYVLGLISDDEAYPIIMNALVALWCLERLQFCVSFDATFAVVDQGWFLGVGKLVQKIAQDERFIHAEIDKKAIQIELKTVRGKKWIAENKSTVKELIDSVKKAEYSWADYLFSEGRKVVNLTCESMKEDVDYQSQEIYETLGIEAPTQIKSPPLKYMENWLDLNKTQNANQEADNATYFLNIIVDDIGEEPMQFIYRN